MKMLDVPDIDSYIRLFPTEEQKVLREIRSIVKKVVPKAEERIRYSMPTFWLKKNLVHFAVMKNHYGFYPTPKVVEKFSKELKGYNTSKGAVQFPKDKPVPFDLVKRMVEYRMSILE